VLDQLVELETGAGIADAVDRMRHPAGGLVFAGLDYLFWGRSRALPPIWVAGGVTAAGWPVTGSGPTRDHALWGVLGELAEAHCRFGADTPRPEDREAGIDRGFGAHPDAAVAAAHARDEAAERRAVRQWWAGCRAARLLAPDKVAAALHLHDIKRRTGHALLALEIATAGDRPVVVAAGFNAQGGDFCFGAACRGSAAAALDAALMELAQAEFALALARMKLRRFGAAGLQPGDRANLRLAAGITRDGLIAHVLAGPRRPAGDEAARDRAVPGGAGQGIVLQQIGCHQGLHVAEARFETPCFAGPAPADAPFGDLAPYGAGA
jgi:hypothetical protein